jgi:hypothetical protein
MLLCSYISTLLNINYIQYQLRSNIIKMFSSKLVQSRLVATRGVQMDYRCLNDESDTDDDNSNEMAAPLLPVMDPRLLNRVISQL